MATIDITATRGDTETYDLAITDAAGDPVDLTGATLWFTAKRSHLHADELAVIRKTTGAGIVVAADQVADRGKATVTLEPDDTAGLLAVRHTLAYDVQVRDAVGAISTPITGMLTIEPDVTVTSS